VRVSAAPTATAVCEPLCGSIPIIAAISTLHIRHQTTGQTAAGMPYTGPALGARPSFEPRHGKVRQSRHIDPKPGTRGRQAVREPAPSDLSGRYGNRSTQSDGLYKAGSVQCKPARWLATADAQNGGYLRAVPGGRRGSAERAHALSRGASASIVVVVSSSRKPPDWCCHSLA